MRRFLCELVIKQAGGTIIEEGRPFLAPSLDAAIDRANHWTAMEPWILGRADALRLTERGQPVWERRLIP